MFRASIENEPTHPGEMLLSEFLKPLGITQNELADGIQVPCQRVNELVNGRRSVTPSTALRLGRFFDTSAGYWMNLQYRWDLFHAERNEAQALQNIQTHRLRTSESLD